jgi:D-psicose/D-tagatose/L-ribulose 3-epimerase
MRFGINTLLWTASFNREHLHLLPRIKRWGFDGVEIARFDFDGFPAAEIRRAIEDEGLACTFCSALIGQMSLASDDAAVRNQARDFIRRGIEVTARLGAGVFVGPYCAPVGLLVGRRRTDAEWARVVDGLCSLTADLDNCGVDLALEPLNRFETYFLNTAADAAALCDAVAHPRIGILFDSFHANIEEKTVGAAVDTAAHRIKHVHACENDRGIPGSGHVDWTGLFAALRRAHYTGWVTIESFGFAIPEIAAAACIWRDLAPDADAIAAEGVRFLRSAAAAAMAGGAAKHSS